jgi:hypothetical protein
MLQVVIQVAKLSDCSGILFTQHGCHQFLIYFIHNRLSRHFSKKKGYAFHLEGRYGCGFRVIRGIPGHRGVLQDGCTTHEYSELG